MKSGGKKTRIVLYSASIILVLFYIIVMWWGITPKVGIERLVQCKYFECLKYEIKDEVKIVADESSFVSLVFIEGSGTIEADDYKQEVPFKAGESFFVSSGKRSINIKGKGTCIVTHV